MISILFFT